MLGERPTGWLEKVLQVMKAAARVPLAALAIVAATLFARIGMYALLRLTDAIFDRWLRNPW
jgi:hypothetical protein